MLQAMALGIVLLAAAYLIALAAVALLAPTRATRFLLAFAATARAHYMELALRGIAGCAFVLRAPHTRFPDAFTVFGSILLLTTLGLAAVPWRWHRAFAQRSVPHATRRLWLVGSVSLVLGTLILIATLAGPTA